MANTEQSSLSGRSAEGFSVETREMEEKSRALENAMASIGRQYGPGTIMRLGAGPASVLGKIPVVSTGCLSLDIALGTGGIPRGRIIEVYGHESSGKTTLTLQLIAECQRKGGIAAFIDAEHALDIRYAEALGVEKEELLVSQPDNAEQALEIADILVRSGALSLIVVDSVAALVPKAELDGDMGSAHVGLQARLMSQALRKLAGAVSRSNAIVVFINQIRMKIGVVFGNPETTSGGNALKFFSSIRLEVRRGTAIKEGGAVVGNRTRIKVVKNKLAPPFKEAEVDMIFGRGFCPYGDVLDQAVERGFIKRSGSWYGAGDERLGQGRENAREALRKRPDLVESLRERIMEQALGGAHSKGEDALVAA